MKFEYELEEYILPDGTSLFANWLLKLKDKKAKAKIEARLLRVRCGNFGDWKPLQNADGICEIREHISPGYRVFYSVQHGKLCCCWRVQPKKINVRLLQKQKPI